MDEMEKIEIFPVGEAPFGRPKLNVKIIKGAAQTCKNCSECSMVANTKGFFCTKIERTVTSYRSSSSRHPKCPYK